MLFTPPLAFQTSRVGLYAMWFAAGCLIGSDGLERRLLAWDGALARRWPAWALLAAATYNGLWSCRRGAPPAVRGDAEVLL